MSDINEMNVGTRWYVVHTYSGYENKVRENLEKIVENRGLGHLIFEVKIPTETITTPKADGEEKVEEVIIFPCYVYVKMIMTDESWHAVRNITGVTGFVGPGSRPVPLTDEEVDALSIEPKHEIKYVPGDKVEIFDGLFAGMEVEVVSVSEDEKNIKVLIPRGRRSITVELPISSVRRIDG